MCKYPDLDIAFLAQQLGFLHVVEQVPETRGELPVLRNHSHRNDSTIVETKIAVESEGVESLWIPTHFQAYSVAGGIIGSDSKTTTAKTVWRKRPTAKVRHRAMMSWPGTRQLLDPIISSTKSSTRPDIDRIIQKLANNQIVSRIPLLQRSCFPVKLTIIEDTSVRNIPYREDYRSLIRRIIELAPKDRVVWLRGDAPGRWICQSSGSTERRASHGEEPTPGSTILVLGDFGRLERKPGLAVRLENSWREWCRLMRLKNCELAALVPFSDDYLSPSIRRLVTSVGWVDKGVEVVRDANRREALVRRLFVLCYPATCVEPSLLRDLRLMVNGASDPSLESDFWQHPWLDGRMPSGAKNDQVQIKAELRQEFGGLPQDMQERVLRRIRNRRGVANAVDLWHSEFLNLPVSVQLLSDEHQSDLEDAEEMVRELAGYFEKQEIDPGVSDLFHWQTWGASDALLTNRKVGKLVTKYRKRFFPEKPIHHELQSTGQGEYKVVTSVAVRAEGNRVEIQRLTPDSFKGSDWGLLRSCDGKLKIKAVPRGEQLFWKSGKKPEWVSDFGIDQYGAWCEFQVPRHGSKGVVTQRMRWIKPGEFMMGSPGPEQERNSNEIQHRVTLTQGYWIADSQVTQELWMAIGGGENPSRFQGETNPVEGVSWEDCQAWLGKLVEHHKSMQLSLPTEAQWEYACRAGSWSAYCFGDDPRKLIQYGWFAEDSKNSTHPVKERQPNDWGVYDMHGNVWEWCSDWYGDYQQSVQSDPTGPMKGTARVIRGGSWKRTSRYMRSACRHRNGPDTRSRSMGFRIACSAQGAEPSEGGMLPIADPGTQRARPIRITIKDQQPLGSDPFWKSGTKPQWVSDYGRDPYGLWCEFQLPRSDDKGVVTQRMRWIPPGEFLMGSPEVEEGRRGDESPSHLVKLSRGYWLADSQVTKELWQCVSLESPSRVPGDNYPVVGISWYGCKRWLRNLNSKVPSLQLFLPTEAQWEYACRAGSTGAYCFGDGPEELPSYGWFRLNSTSKLHPVKQLQPNGWGLYDMHGNAWEWCNDWYGIYRTFAQADPTGPAKGVLRVIRGGGWHDNFLYLRSACREGFRPQIGGSYLSCRIACSAQGAEPNEGAMLPEAERSAERARVGSAAVEYGFLRSIDLDATVEISPEKKFSEIDLNAYTSVRVVSDQESYQFDRLEKPIWAVEFGCDSYGLHASFEVSTVRQRMRWIPPGRFLMGSPDGKNYGRRNEYPQHEVILTHGYWMFDTPCRQRLWSALMEKNSSYFVHEDRPVETIRWEEAVAFAKKLSERLAEGFPTSGRNLFDGWNRLQFRLPTEAEWEYACRAGTTGDTYAGNLEIQGDANAPLLDAIAWYGGNSGHEYDLDKSVSLERAWLRQRQFHNAAGGTRNVGTKAPNPWGLYDMLGNVWEWCNDWYADDIASLEPVNPQGPTNGDRRVFRGGSWNSPARYLRSAYRHNHSILPMMSSHGFRLVFTPMADYDGEG